MFSSNSTQVSSEANYIESCFSTWLYNGTGANQTITNNIDLSTKGGLVWTKSRGPVNRDHCLADTARGTNKLLFSNLTMAQDAASNTVTAFNSSGYSLGTDNLSYGVNITGDTYASWTFAKQTKFFDVVTWTGDGTATRQITHNLGSAPGFIITKTTSATSPWYCYHRSLTTPNNYAIRLNLTNAAFDNGVNVWNVTSTSFQVGDTLGNNASGVTYVAYLFAHNAGGFGLTGTDNVISCGSFTTNASNGVTGEITLGYEPQWVMMKCLSTTSNWIMVDVMRGFSQTNFEELKANTSAAASPVSGNYIYPTATGFRISDGTLNASQTWIYIAIRRGPMKVPTDATTVFSPKTETTTTVPQTVTTGFPVDLCINTLRDGGFASTPVMDRLRGGTTTSYNYLTTTTTAAEATGGGAGLGFDSNIGLIDNNWLVNPNAILWNFRRAPSFFDEVCYTGDGVSGRQIAHNLAAVPELMIVKQRGPNNRGWQVYQSFVGPTKFLSLQTSDGANISSFRWNDTAPTATVFSIGDATPVNESGSTFVAYLFATCAGVSKVGNYTGNGTTQTINCGFTGGARFVLIKRTDDFGDWYVYDTARGMTVLTDPYLRLNSTAAEVATLGSVTTVSTGFALNSAILSAINVNGGSYIFLAIA